MSSLLSTFTEIVQIDSRTRPGTIAIPLTTEIPNRVFTVKDTYGASANSTITLLTQGSDLFENGQNTMILSNNFGSVTLHAGIANRWSVISGTILNSINASSITTSTLFLQSGPQAWSLTGNTVFSLQNISTATNVFTVDISSITRFNGPLMASTLTVSSFTLYDRGALQMKNLQLSSSYLLVNGEIMSSIASGGGGGLTSLNLQSTVQGLGSAGYLSTAVNLTTLTTIVNSTVIGLGTQGYVSSLQSTVQGLGASGYISSTQFQSSIQGLGQTYVSSALTSQTLTSSIQGLGQTYLSSALTSQNLTSTVQGLGQTYVSTQSFQSTVQALGLTNVSGTLGISTLAPYARFTVDINGPTQSAVYYSSITAGGTTTITPANFGVFYNITTSGTYTLAFSASQAASNIGKYNCFRNNCGANLTLTLTGVSGITSPVTVSNAQSATFVVATTTTYALF